MKRIPNEQLKFSFKRHAESLMEALNLGSGIEMSKDQALEYYDSLQKSVF